MLYRIMGPVGAGKRELLLNEAQRVFQAGGKILFLVPEQATAQYERSLIALCGSFFEDRIQVTNFSRLPNLVLREYGEIAQRNLTEIEKKLLFFEAVKELSPSLTTLSLRRDPESLDALYRELEEFRMAGLDAAALKELSEKEETDPQLSQKLGEIHLILSRFRDTLALYTGRSCDEAEHLSQVLLHYPYFQNTTVFLDAFWDLTAPQEILLKRILSQAKDVWISFAADKNEPELFQKGIRFARRCLLLARECKVQVRDERLFSKEETSSLSYLKNHLLSYAPPKKEIPEGIRIVACANRSQEASFVAGKILELVKDGASWNEIAVLSRNPDRDEILTLTLEAEGIPTFAEEKESLPASPLAETLLLARSLSSGQGTEEELRRYLTAGVVDYPETDRFLLEKYVATWSLSGRVVLKSAPFSMNPQGYEEMKEEDRILLDRINRCKEEIFLPLRQLAFALTKGKNKEKIGALVAYLQAVGAERLLQRDVKKAKEAGDFHRAGALVRTWNCVLERLSSLGRCLGEKESSPEHFAALLRLALSGNLPGALPSGQDRVLISQIPFARPENVRFLFLLGMNAGSFPAAAPLSGTLQASEREYLNALGYPLSCQSTEQNDEFFYFYLALSYPRDGIFLSYLTGEENGLDAGAVSVFIKRVQTVFPALKAEAYQKEREIPKTKEAVFHYWLRHLSRKEPVIAALAERFLNSETFKERALKGANAMALQNEEHRLESTSLLSGEKPAVSYSRLEKYTLCPYSYFAQYHLNAKKSGKAKFGANVVGTFIHSVLEEIFKELSLEGKKLRDLSDAELEERNARACRRYWETALSQTDSHRVQFLIRQVTASCLLILENLKREFSVSQFQPAFFELDLTKLGEGYRIPLPDGRSILLRGSIDRVDLYQKEDGTPYARVIDYKSRDREFDLIAVANGLNMQMLLYLFAIWDQGVLHQGKEIHPLPAGALYLNGMEKSVDCQSQQALEEFAQAPFSVLNRKGFLTNDPELFRAQDPKGQGEFIPIEWNNSRSKKKKGLFSLEELGKLKIRTEKKIREIAEQMQKGEICALPLCKKGEKGPCDWCEYLPLCKRDPEKKRPYLEHLTREEIFGEEESNG